MEGLFLFQPAPVLGQLVFTRLDLGELTLTFLLLAFQLASLFRDGVSGPDQLAGLNVEAGLSGDQLLLAERRLAGQGIDFVLAFLHLARGAVDGFLQQGESVPAFSVAVVQLLPEGRQFEANGVQLLLAPIEQPFLGFDVPLTNRQLRVVELAGFRLLFPVRQLLVQLA